MSPTPPRVTIGMPVHNGEDYLEDSLASILGQTYEDFELLIADNASSDRTEGICRAHSERDGRIRYFRSERNLGAAKNFNRLVELAEGEYFKWAAHDDLLAPTYLERCAEQLETHPEAVLCYPRTERIDAQGEPLGNYPDELDLRQPRPSQRFAGFHQVYRRSHLCNPIFGLMRTAALKRTALIGSFVSSDMVLLGELTLHGEFHEVPEALFFRRDHPKGSVHARPAYYQRIAWFDPSKAGTLQLTHWHWLLAYLRSIRRAPIEAAEKRRCYRTMVKWAGWNLRGLVKDLVKAPLWPFIRPFLRSN